MSRWLASTHVRPVLDELGVAVGEDGTFDASTLPQGVEASQGFCHSRGDLPVANHVGTRKEIDTELRHGLRLTTAMRELGEAFTGRPYGF